ncbi:MAG TPA: hypothetical protein VNM87_08685 [Candidatus Udaeobacter sp.]|nr:hypothetical protein [Candidatus Udaeobacter sp.]
MNLPSPARRALWIGLAVALGLVFLIAETHARLIYLGRLEVLRARIAAEASAGGNPVPAPRRILPNPFLDGYLWLDHAERLLADGGFRIRETPFDNAPIGRPVHWSSLPIWWLIALGAAAGRPLAEGVERAAPLAGPILLALALPGCALVAAHASGVFGALLIVLALTGAYPLAETFCAGNVDHHGFIVLATLGALLNLCGALRAQAAGDARSARRWAIGSGIAVGIGLWLSAVTTSMVVIGIGAGALLAWNAARGRGSAAPLLPATWRAWGLACALTSLAAYLVEYFPSHLGLRLEVNHPLYAVALLGGSEVLALLSELRMPARTPRRSLRLALALAAVAALPLAIILGGARVYALSDPFLWRLHQDIEEFRPLPALLGRLGWGAIAAVSPLPIYLVLALGLLRARGGEPAARVLTWFALGPALFLSGLAMIQLRWMGEWLSALAVLGGACTALLLGGRPGRGRIALAILPLLALLLSAFGVVARFGQATHDRSVAADDVGSLVLCDMAQVIARDCGQRPAIVLASPDATVHLAWFGRLCGVGTLYWENREGLAASTELFNAGTAEEARTLLARRNIDYVVLFSERSFLGTFYRLAHGGSDDDAARATFFGRLLFADAEPPGWLRRVPYRLPMSSLAGRPLVARIFAVQK